MRHILQDTPVDIALKSGPRGNGKWPGFTHVYTNIAEGARKMGLSPHVRLGECHVNTMADLGSGQEERMKWRQMWLREYGWIA